MNKGRRIGRYEIIEEIGHGGMAVVYRAMDTVLEREVALKLLHPHLASHAESRQRFLREAKAVARLKHSSVVEIYDYSEDEEGEIYIAMELVKGTSLRRFMDQRQEERFSSEAAVLIMREVAIALAHAHENGIIHRDVKPENILIDQKGRVKLSDFGIAHLAGVSQMTVTGQILGSPSYMSPEHIEKSELDERADIFSFGTVMYELAIGRKPFEGATAHSVIKHIVEGKYNDPLRINPAAGHDIGRVLRKCLANQPDKRYASAKELAADLDQLLESMGVNPKPNELIALFADPCAWIDRSKPTVIAKTLAMGLAAKKMKRHPEATDHFNRVLALEPGNETALAAVAGMSRDKLVKRIVERTILAIPVIIAIGAVAWTMVGDEKENPKSRSLAKRKENIAQAASDNTKKTIKSPEESTPEKIESKELETKPGEEIPNKTLVSKARESREVFFTPNPLAVEIVIDDQERFPYGPSNRKRILTTGKHNISFIPNDEKRFMTETWQVNIPSGSEPFYFRKRLRWKPAVLFIESPVDASVIIKGRATGSTNKPFNVDIKDGPAEQVTLLVSAQGYIPKTKQITLQAGERIQEKISIEKGTDTD